MSLPKYETADDALNKALAQLKELIPQLTNEQKEEISLIK